MWYGNGVCRTEIEWAAGKNLTQKVMKKKPKKGAKNTKPVTKTEECESFFNFFTPPQVPEDDDIDQDTAEQLQDSMEQDYDIGYVGVLSMSTFVVVNLISLFLFPFCYKSWLQSSNMTTAADKNCEYLVQVNNKG